VVRALAGCALVAGTAAACGFASRLAPAVAFASKPGRHKAAPREIQSAGITMGCLSASG
jgi:hypothetical protein